LDVIIRNSKTLKIVVEDILDVLKIESGSLSLKKEKLSSSNLALYLLLE
jgi:hypothetical protein